MKSDNKKVLEGIGSFTGNGECGMLHIKNAKVIDNTKLRNKQRSFTITDEAIHYEELFPDITEDLKLHEEFKFKITIEVWKI